MPLTDSSFAELRRNLPAEPMEPSAPIYMSVSSLPKTDIPVNKTMEDEISAKSSPTYSTSAETEVSLQMMKIELDLKRARLKKEQLEKEKQLVEEDFRVRMELVDSEIQMAVAKLESLHEETSERPTNTRVNATVQNQVSKSLVPNTNFVHTLSSPTERVVVSANRVSFSGTNERNVGLTEMASGGVAPMIFNSIAIEQLRVLDCVTIRQLRSHSLNESYEVVAPGENFVIFRVNVTISVVDMQREVRLEFIDNEVNEMMVFRSKEGQFMELFICGQLVSFVKKAPTYFKPMLLVYDNLGKPVLKIKGPGMASGKTKHDFNVQTITKISIGSINKRPTTPSLHYTHSHAVLQFPLDLDVRFKATLIASNFLIIEEQTSAMRDQKLSAARAAAGGRRHGQQGSVNPVPNYPRSK